MKRSVGRVLIAGLVFLGACERVKPLEAPAPLGPVTETEAETWGKLFAGALSACEPTLLNRHFDLEGNLRLALRSTSMLPPLQRQEFAMAMDARNSQVSQLLACGAGQTFIFDGVRGTDENRSVLIGAYEDSLLVSEYQIGKNAEGRVVGRDVFSHNNGQVLSERFAEILDMLQGDVFNRDEVLAVYSGVQEAAPNALVALENLTRESRSAAAMKRAVFMHATNLGPKEFAEAKEKFCAERNGVCPPMHLSMASAHTASENWAGVAEELTALSEQLGRPKELHAFALGTLAEAGQPTRFREEAERYLEEYPTSQEAWRLVVMARAATGELAEATAAMRESGERLELSWDDTDLEAFELLANLKDTPEWQDYVAWRDANFAAKEPAAPSASE